MTTPDAARPARIVFLDRDTFPAGIVLRPPSFPHELHLFAATAPDEVGKRIADADIVITNKVPVRAIAIEGAPRLKMIAVAATGYDIVDVAACAARAIAVANIRNYALHTVPEHTFALILALRRSIGAYRDSVAAGAWQRSGQFCYFDYPIRDLSGYTPFEDVLRRSDVITLHCPLLPATRNMIATAEFALMERRPLLINTARGGLVDEAALAEALHAGQIAGAAFDVVTTEPPPAHHPFMSLLELRNFILTPHVAWASHEAIQGLADQLVENIELFWRGTPRNVVSA